MAKMIDLVGLTNALTDIVVNVQDSDLELLGLKKAFYMGMGRINHDKFFRFLSKRKKNYCQAGSPANTIFNASALGLNTALFGTVGNDSIGELYIKKLKETGIKPLISICEGKSGICYVLISKDGERTCVSNIGVSGAFNFNLNRLKKARAFHTSAYELATNPGKILDAIDYAKGIEADVSFDLADSEMIRRQRKNIEEIVNKADILFMTEKEAEELTGHSPEKSLTEMGSICRIVALKKGSKGSVVKKGNEQYDISVYPANVISTCGAGDAYASGFLFGYLRHFPLKECGNMGSYIASRVCSMKESHLYQKSIK